MSEEFEPKHYPGNGRDSDPAKKKKTIIAVGAIALAVVVFVSALFFSGTFNRLFTADDTDCTALFTGNWKIDDVTAYEFNGAGSGVMHTNVKDYAFSYSADSTVLHIDFESPAARDCDYRYSFSGATLMIYGNGFRYQMTKTN